MAEATATLSPEQITGISSEQKAAELPQSLTLPEGEPAAQGDTPQPLPSQEAMDKARPQILSDRIHEHATYAAMPLEVPKQIDRTQYREEMTKRYEWFGSYAEQADAIQQKGLSEKETQTLVERKRKKIEKKRVIPDGEKIELTAGETQLAIDKKKYRVARKFVKEHWDDAEAMVNDSQDGFTSAADRYIRSAFVTMSVEKEEKAVGEITGMADEVGAGVAGSSESTQDVVIGQHHESQESNDSVQGKNVADTQQSEALAAQLTENDRTATATVVEGVTKSEPEVTGGSNLEEAVDQTAALDATDTSTADGGVSAAYHQDKDTESVESAEDNADTPSAIAQSRFDSMPATDAEAEENLKRLTDELKEREEKERAAASAAWGKESQQHYNDRQEEDKHRAEASVAWGEKSQQYYEGKQNTSSKPTEKEYTQLLKDTPKLNMSTDNSQPPTATKPTEEEYTQMLKDTETLNMSTDNTQSAISSAETPQVDKNDDQKKRRRKGLFGKLALIGGLLGGAAVSTQVNTPENHTADNTTQTPYVQSGELTTQNPADAGYQIREPHDPTVPTDMSNGSQNETTGNTPDGENPTTVIATDTGDASTPEPGARMVSGDATMSTGEEVTNPSIVEGDATTTMNNSGPENTTTDEGTTNENEATTAEIVVESGHSITGELGYNSDTNVPSSWFLAGLMIENEQLNPLNLDREKIFALAAQAEREGHNSEAWAQLVDMTWNYPPGTYRYLTKEGFEKLRAEYYTLHPDEVPHNGETDQDPPQKNSQ